jgi:hypothetical protein
MPTAAFQEARREQVSFLAPLEKRLLVWLAHRTPRWINSDHLTALGLLSLLGAGLSYWYARYSHAGLSLAIAFLALNWLGDSLDGTLARVRNHQRPRYGFYVDRIVDAFGTFFLLAGLALSRYWSSFIPLYEHPNSCRFTYRLLHAFHRGISGHLHDRHVSLIVLEVQPHRVANPAGDRQSGAVLPPAGTIRRRDLQTI